MNKNELRISASETFTSITISELSKKLKTTDIQRVLNEEHYLSIYNNILSLFEQGLHILSVGVLILAELDQDLFILDGQHRFQAFMKLYKETKYDHTFVINIIKVSSEEEMRLLFNRINDTIPANSIPQGINKTLCNDILKYFTLHYKEFFKNNKGGGVQRPNIDFITFEQHINVLSKIYPNDLLQRLKDLNDQYKLCNYTRFVESKSDTATKINGLLIKVKDKGGLYFGMFRDLKNAFESLYINRKTYIEPRTCITPALRDMIWRRYVGKEKGECCFCQTDINVNTCHMAHDLAHSLGGEETIENLFPCCANCNLKMHTTGYLDFKGV
jgi:hypothetical protein